MAKLDNKAFLRDMNDLHGTLRLTATTESKISVLFKIIGKELEKLVEFVHKDKKALEYIVIYDADSLLLQLDSELDRLEQKLGKTFIGIMNAAVDSAYTSASNTATAQLGRIKKVPQYKPTPKDKRIITMLKDTDFSLIKTLSKSHIAEARAIFVQGMQDGLSQSAMVDQLMKRVRNSEYNAKRIIRTEITRTANTAAKKRYIDGGLKYWQWNTALDERVCETCAPLHGKVVKIGSPFNRHFNSAANKYIKGTELFQPPLHPFCRCGVSPAFGTPTPIVKPKPKPKVPSPKFNGFGKSELDYLAPIVAAIPNAVRSKVKVLNGSKPIVKTKGRLIDDPLVKAIIPVATLTKYKNATGFYVGGDINRVFVSGISGKEEILHEIGHAIHDEYLSSVTKGKWIIIHNLHKQTGDFPSARCSVNRHEHFADAFKLFILKPQLLINRFPEIYSFVKENIFYGEGPK